MTSSPSSSASARRKKRIVLLCLLFVASVGVWSYRSWQGTRPYEWSGTVEARMTSVGSRTGGRVLDVLVREGDLVTQGQALLTIERGDLDSQRLGAEGRLKQAQAGLDRLVKGARPEEIDGARAHAQAAAAALAATKAGSRPEQVAAARARVVAAQVITDKAQRDLDRARELFAEGSIAAAELDAFDSALAADRAQGESAIQALAELDSGARREDVQQALARSREAQASAELVLAGSRIEDVAAAAGEVAEAKGKLDAILVAIGELVVRTPRRLRVEALDLRPGDILAPNATAATLLEDGELYARIYVPETLIGRIRVGQTVRVVVDSFPDRSFAGLVEHINKVGEYSPRSLQTADERADQVFAIRIGLREGQEQLRAGMAATIRVAR